MTTQTHTLDTVDILAGYGNDDWLGFGYLGERRNAQDTTDPECAPVTDDRLAAADAAILSEANRRRWTPSQLFQWLNSRDGRHYGDAAFGTDAPINAAPFFRGW
jgi:hypothetical protein